MPTCKEPRCGLLQFPQEVFHTSADGTNANYCWTLGGRVIREHTHSPQRWEETFFLARTPAGSCLSASESP
eukprot:4170625-Amphidinium_carterae.1